MGLIKFIGTVSVMGYILGILYNFADFSYTQKAIRLTAALYIVTILLSPLQHNEIYIDTVDIFRDVYSPQQDSTDYIIESAELNLKKTIKAVLDEKNISYTDIIVHINKQSEKIFVDCIEIYGVKTEDKNDVISLLSDIGTVVVGDKNGE